ncbi:hypothetical protein DCS_03142 [Drechmeria coniospora]|uniref:Uncharacterized protein n=1 Tax=Drechmeria coniospora TaxID=98403 RepID=A0A151GY30_DRECN|nr:hypothetical protein DCS_03142 [Drechmeria coniospora]KYK61997.1 hypothetical protein DCS_03142 [Drechmeria coniospora]
MRLSLFLSAVSLGVGAIPCLLSAISNSTCKPTDLECLCADDRAQDDAGRCIKAKCPLSDALSAQNTTLSSCNVPSQDRSQEYVNIVIPLGVFALVFTVTRLVFKRFFSAAKRLCPDDWAILGTVVICIPAMVIDVEGLAAHGLGRDIWTLTTSDISTFALYFYVMEILYIASISLIKLSLSLFYLQLFSGAVVRVLLWCTVGVNVLFGFVFIIVAIFQCTPVSYYWNQYVDANPGGQCININLVGWLNAAIGVLIDLWMIGLPLTQVMTLRLHWKKKVGVIIMFLFGTFITIVSILRLHSLIYFATSDNPTWDLWTPAVWSVIEVNVGMICTCLPALRLMLVRLFPKIFDGSRSTSYAHGTSSSQDRSAARWSKSRPEEAAMSGMESHGEAAAVPSDEP